MSQIKNSVTQISRENGMAWSKDSTNFQSGTLSQTNAHTHRDQEIAVKKVQGNDLIANFWPLL